MPLSYWITTAITLISAVVSFGFSVDGFRGASEGGRTPSLYAFARSLALMVAAVIAIFTGSIGFVAAVAIAMVIVQAVDAIVGLTIHNRMKTVGPAVTAALNLAALIWLLLSGVDL